MELKDRIEGKIIKRVIADLIEDKTFIKIKSDSDRDEQLTIITDQMSSEGVDYFLADAIDPSIADSVEELLPLKFSIEFTGRDGLPYQCQTVGITKIDQQLWFRFPDVLFRVQKRNDFRIKIPKGASVRFETHCSCYEFMLDNISLGGAFGFLDGIVHRTGRPKDLKRGDHVKNTTLRIPVKGKLVEIKIERSQVIRIEERAKKSRWGCALQFKKISPQERKKLVQTIYDIQRDHLKKRIKV